MIFDRPQSEGYDPLGRPSSPSFREPPSAENRRSRRGRATRERVEEGPAQRIVLNGDRLGPLLRGDGLVRSDDAHSRANIINNVHLDEE